MQLLSEFRLLRKSEKKKNKAGATIKTSSDLILGGMTGAGIGATLPALSTANTPKLARKFADDSKNKIFNNSIVGDIGKRSRALAQKVPINSNTPLQSKLAIAGLGLGLGATAANKIKKRMKSKTK